jgi:hypothetical protein
VAFLNLSALVNLAIQNNTPNVVIKDIYTSLLPVTFFVTQYTYNTTATSQEPVLVEKAQQLKAVLYAGPSISSLSPLATGQVVYLSESSPGFTILPPSTVAVFPTLQVYHLAYGYLAQSPVVELPVPTFMGTFSSTWNSEQLISVSNGQLTVSSPVYYNTTATVYFNLQLYYGTIMVGSGVFNATYTYSTSGFAPAAVNSYLIEPVFQAYYANGANNTLYAVGPEKQIAVATGTILSETAYTAVQVMLYKVEFVNLCNQTLTQGVVEVSTPYGTFNLSLAFAYPYTVLQYPVQVNMWGVPVSTVTPTASFTLYYFGYVMPPVNPFTRQAITTPITLQPTVVNLIYFPLIDIVFQVVTNGTTPPNALPGFVVCCLQLRSLGQEDGLRV